MRRIWLSLLILAAAVSVCAETTAQQPPSQKPTFQGAVALVHIGDPRKGEASYIVVAAEKGKSRSFRVNDKVVIIDNQRRRRLLLRQVQKGAPVLVRYRIRKQGRPQALAIWVLASKTPAPPQQKAPEQAPVSSRESNTRY